MSSFDECQFGMCGKSIGALRRNVIRDLKRILPTRGYHVEDRRGDNMLIIRRGDVTNYFLMFGGKDESSQDNVQGVTLAGVLLDEVALMPESFVNQATGRCSVEGAKLWFNCNPGSRRHWFKMKWINQYKAKRLLYIQALDKAHIMVMSGATSYATAMKEIVDELAEHQAYVRYPTGHTDTLEVAVLRAVRTGTAQASGNMSISTMEQYGWDIVLTSAHLGARYGDGGPNPGNHFWWQGRFFSRSGKDPRFPSFIESTGYGTGEGLCGWNCRHSFGPGDGVHNPWTKYDAEENKRAYDLSQMQRKKERNIRSQTKKVEAFKEAVAAAQSDDVRKVMQEALKEEQGKLTSLRKDYSNFCDDNGLKRQAFRLQVAKAKQQDAERSFYTQPSQPPVNTGLTENSKDGTIDIEVDEMTPCLRKNSTGELVDTTVRSISPTRATCKGWEFDWTKPERDGYQVFALRVKGERKIQGMIAMKDDPGNYAMKIDIVEAAPQNNPHNPLNTSGTKEYNGVGGHLFAEACRQSFEKGYGGFVHFVAKTNLIPHYAKTLGAELLNSRDRIMAIDGPAALALVKRYYGGGK